MVKESQIKRHEHMIHTFMSFFWQKTIRNLGIWIRKKGLEEENVQRKCQQLTLIHKETILKAQ
jgi:hypothetical protein